MRVSSVSSLHFALLTALAPQRRSLGGVHPIPGPRPGLPCSVPTPPTPGVCRAQDQGSPVQGEGVWATTSLRTRTTGPLCPWRRAPAGPGQRDGETRPQTGGLGVEPWAQGSGSKWQPCRLLTRGSGASAGPAGWMGELVTAANTPPPLLGAGRRAPRTPARTPPPAGSPHQLCSGPLWPPRLRAELQHGSWEVVTRGGRTAVHHGGRG